jgi:hypothetical protein
MLLEMSSTLLVERRGLTGCASGSGSRIWVAAEAGVVLGSDAEEDVLEFTFRSGQ